MASSIGIRRFLRTLSAVGLLHPRKGAPEGLTGPDGRTAMAELAGVWFELLEDVDDRALAEATGEYLRDPKVCQWFPQPGQIIERVQLRQKTEALAAWSMLVTMVERGELGQHVKAGTLAASRDRHDRMLAAISACGGTHPFRMMDRYTEKALREQFVAAYNGGPYA